MWLLINTYIRRIVMRSFYWILQQKNQRILYQWLLRQNKYFNKKKNVVQGLIHFPWNGAFALLFPVILALYLLLYVCFTSFLIAASFFLLVHIFALCNSNSLMTLLQFAPLGISLHMNIIMLLWIFGLAKYYHIAFINPSRPFILNT